MNCELCGSPVRVVGRTTKHYEPIFTYEKIEKVVNEVLLSENQPPSVCCKETLEFIKQALKTTMGDNNG